jgi:hypothetical protein
MAANIASKKSVIKYNYSQHLPYFWGGDGHLRCGVCNTAFICETCRGWVSSPDVVHICLGDKCIYCRKSVDLNHIHNGAGYDTHFIHEYMVRNGSYPEIITQGARIIFMCHTLQHYVI